MNPNRLARSHGFFNWDDLISSAKSAKALRTELRAARDLVLPTAMRAERIENAAAALVIERRLVAAEWRKLAEFCESRAELGTFTAEEHRKRARFATEMAAGVEAGERAR